MSDWPQNTALAKTVWDLGFQYDPTKNIIVSRMQAWQRQVGFCWAYDVLCPAMMMVIDCEPIYFSYGGKDWMIEPWKGQYGIETGGEIGIYRTALNPPSPPAIITSRS